LPNVLRASMKRVSSAAISSRISRPTRNRTSISSANADGAFRPVPACPDFRSGRWRGNRSVDLSFGVPDRRYQCGRR
jgi:hypothetical protein